MDVEATLNNRPLGYMEEDIKLTTYSEYVNTWSEHIKRTSYVYPSCTVTDPIEIKS